MSCVKTKPSQSIRESKTSFWKVILGLAALRQSMANRGQKGNPRKQNVVQRNLFESCTLYTFLRAYLREFYPSLTWFWSCSGTKLVLWPLFDRVVFFCTSCMLLVAKLEDICKSWHDLQAHIFQELDCYVLRRCALYTKSDREKSDWWNLKRVVLLEKTMLQDVSPASSHSSNNTSVQIQRLQTTTIVLYKYWDLSNRAGP